MNKLCFMFGHRDMPEGMLPELCAAVERAYLEYGARCFVIGHYGNFDRIGKIALRLIKQKYPDMRLEMLTPYHPSERKLEIPQGFDGTIYPDGMENVPKRFAIVRANEYMIRRCDCIICHACHFGNARLLLEKARKRGSGISILNIV